MIVKLFLSLRICWGGVKGGVIIDVGAHIGKYAILAARMNRDCKVIAIEPSADNFRILKKNVALNRLRNIILLNMAIGNKDGSVKLFSPGLSGHHSIKTGSGEYELVKIRTLDTLLDSLNIEKVDLMKIDAEGAEYDILLGAKSSLKSGRLKNIIMEISNDDDLARFKRMLGGLGYVVEKIEYVNYIVRHGNDREACKAVA